MIDIFSILCLYVYGFVGLRDIRRMKMVTRKELGEEIVGLAYTCNNSYPFGGYVRDQVAGVDFNDIDIWVGRHNTAEDLFAVLQGNGWNTKWVGAKGNYYVNHIFRNKMVASKAGRTIEIDCVYSVLKNNPFLFGADVDVNFLYSVNGNIMLAECMKGTTSLAEVMAHIHSKEYASDDTVEARRIKKIESKGYKRVSIIKPEAKMVEVKSIYKCADCCDTGEIVLFFSREVCKCKK